MSGRATARWAARGTAALLGVLVVACSFPDPTFYELDGGTTSDRCDGGLCPPTVIASNQGEVTGLVADDRGVFWVAYPEGTAQGWVRGRPLTAGAAQDLAMIADSVGPMALDEASVYAVRSAPGGNIYKIARGGGASVPLWDRTDVSQVLLDASFVYYEAPYGLGRVSKTGVAGGANTRLAPAGTDLLDVIDNDLLTRVDDRMLSFSKDGSVDVANGRVLLTGVAPMSGFARWERRFYWTVQNTGVLLTWSSDDAAPKMLVQGESAPSRLLADARHLQWMDSSSGSVRRLPRAGGTPETIGRARLGPLAQNATHLFWTTAADGGSVVMWGK